MKKLILILGLSFTYFMSFTQVLQVTDSIAWNDCDSSQVYLLNYTPMQMPAYYYQWQINGVMYPVGLDQSPFELWISNSNFNYVILHAYTDASYSTAVEVYTYTILTDTCNPLSATFTYSYLNSTCTEATILPVSTISGGASPYYYYWEWQEFDASGNVIYMNSTAEFPTVDITSSASSLFLSVTDINGNSYTYNENIVFNSSNMNPFSTSSIITSDCSTTTVQFYGSALNADNWVWIFEGNSGIDSAFTQNPVMTFDNNSGPIYAFLTVSDTNGCVESNPFIMPITLSGSSITGNATVTNNSSNPCFSGSCDFEIYLNASSGTAPFLFSIDSGIPSYINTFSNLCAGNYEARIEDATGCVTEFTVFVEDSSSLWVQEYTYFANCDSGSTGSSSIAIETNIFNTILWNDGSTNFYIPNPIQGTVYTYIVTSPDSCTVSGSITVPTNNCYTITGNVYADLNADCIFNGSDYDLSYVWVDLTDASGNWLNIYDYTDASGNFSISAPAGTYYFDINGYYVNSFTQTCPSIGYSVTIGASNPNAVVDFYMTPPAPVQDLSISLYSFTTFTPGFPYWAYISYCNPGTMPMSGTVVMNYDADMTYDIGSSLGAVNDAINNTLTWSFTNLMPGQCSSFYPNFTVATTVPLGNTMSNTVIVNPISGDVTPSNNTAYVIDTVVGSWDPNDKAVYPIAGMTVEEKDHDYTIRFQNKGTAPATFIIVRDDLDDNLDLQTLRNVSASHNFVLTIENTDELVFTFNNIMLPAEQDDEAGSNGNIHYTISQKENLPLGTVINNTAYIYFDFNEAVVTNTTENTIVEKTTSIDNLSSEISINVYPNPTNGLINIETEKGNNVKTIEIYNIIGEKIFEAIDLNSNKAFVNIDNSNEGVYILKINTEKGTMYKKVSLKK